MKKALFIDRDGTLIVEPPEDFQVDSLEKLEFIPKVFRSLYLISNRFDYELVMVTNQDGLGTSSFPEDRFWPAHNKMIKAFENEGVRFDDVIIDKTLPKENAPTRKPGTALLKKYTTEGYDLKNSFVIGDRITDIELAKNLGSRAILFSNDKDSFKKVEQAGLKKYCSIATNNWYNIYEFLMKYNSIFTVERSTGETKVKVEISIDGTGKSNISTGLGFFDHMLDQIARHSGIDLSITVTGDMHVDEHHTIEDTALVLGEAFNLALGKKIGMERYGFVLPMDDSLAQVAIDFGGRNWIEWKAEFKREKVGDMPTEMFFHFFKSFTDAAKCNLNIKAEGTNEHHKIEAIFKAFAKAIKMAIKRDPLSDTLPSTKGVL